VNEPAVFIFKFINLTLFLEFHIVVVDIAAAVWVYTVVVAVRLSNPYGF
jgi:hypothetical protein